jgi:TRAP-type C4-dicarboxylate transport system substrate-binding protein
MKKLFGILLAALVCFVFCVPGTVAAAEQAIKIKFTDSYPVGHLANKGNVVFKNRLEEITKGKVVVEYYPAEQLGKLKDLLRLVSTGVSDMSYLPVPPYAGQLSMNTVAMLPFYTTAAEGTAIYQRLVTESPELIGEFNRYGLHPIASMVNSTCQYDIGTIKKQVKKPEDLNGLRIRTGGGVFDKIAKKYGIATVTIASPEVYEAAQRGIVDGIAFSFASVKGYRTNELEKYHTLGLRMGAWPAAYGMNKKKWDSLPKDIQAAVLQAGKDSSRYFAENWDKEQVELAAQYEKEGMVLTRVSKADLANWMKPLKGIEEEWAKDMDGKKLPGQAVLKQYLKLCNEIVAK